MPILVSCNTQRKQTFFFINTGMPELSMPTNTYWIFGFTHFAFPPAEGDGVSLNINNPDKLIIKINKINVEKTRYMFSFILKLKIEKNKPITDKTNE